MSQEIQPQNSIADIKARIEDLHRDGSLSRYIEVRHMLTENVTRNLYKGALENEGKDALKIRNILDETIFKATEDDLIAGSREGLSAMKRGIKIENLAEQFEFLAQIVKAGAGNAKKIQTETQKLIDSPFLFGRFSADRQRLIEQSACSSGTQKILNLIGFKLIPNLIAKGRIEQIIRSIELEVQTINTQK